MKRRSHMDMNVAVAATDIARTPEGRARIDAAFPVGVAALER